MGKSRRRAGALGVELPSFAAWFQVSSAHPVKILPGRLGPFSTYFVDPWGINMPSCTGAFLMLLHIGREPGLELAHQRAKARHDGDRLEQRP